jgi:NAD(P)-dependent dehydrogenase (short-subunit alcohol dehydrogenase family)
MRVLVVGGTGTIGVAVVRALERAGHDVVPVGVSSGDLTVDLSDKASIQALYEEVGAVDAVVCAAGVAKFGVLEELEDADFQSSIENKMMGQVNLVRLGIGRVAEDGSFTLTTGGLSQNPTPGTSAVAMVGAGVEGFVKGAALDLEGRYRVNVVSPGWVAESRQRMGLEPMPGIWAADLALYYLTCVEGDMSGQILAAERPMTD